MGTSMAQAQPSAAGDEAAIADLTNDALVIRLHYTINHLSRWLTPIHDQTRLQRTVRRGEPSVKELVLRLRDEENRVFPLLHAIANRATPDLDKLPPPVRTPDEVRRDGGDSTVRIMAEFRRLRHSTCSLLRGMPDVGWDRMGVSRRGRNRTLRDLAEHLVTHDWEVLAEMDRALDRVGAREGIAAASRVHLPELLRLAPTDRRP